MNLIWRHTLRSTAGNPAQAIVVFLTVVLTTALIFVGFGMSDLFYDMTRAEYNRDADNADIIVGSHSPSNELFSLARLETAVAEKGGVSRLESYLKLAGIAKTEERTMTAVIEATDLETYFENHTIRYSEHYDPSASTAPGQSFAPNEYRAAVVGASTAAEYGIHAGDVISVYLETYNYYAQLRVEYVALDEGIFASPATNVILTDFRSVGNLGQVNAAYLTLDGSVSYDEYVEYLKELFPSVTVKEGDSDSEVRSISENNTLLLSIGIVFIVALMVLILATSYLIIGRNRVSELVIFKAAGASPAGSAVVLFAEVIWYALLGGLGGLLLGRLALGLAGYVLLPPSVGGIHDKWWKYVVSLLLSIWVTVAAASGTVIGMSRKTIRQLTSDNTREAKRPNYALGGASAAVLAGAAVAVHFTTGVWSLVLTFVLVASLAAFIAFATGAVLELLSWIVRRLGAKGIWALASRTAARNKSVRTLSSVAAAFITFAFLIVQVIGIVDSAIIPFRSRFDAADFIVTANRMATKEEVEALETVIKNSYGIGTTGYMVNAGVKWVDDENKSTTVYGFSDWAILSKFITPTPDIAARTRWFQAEHPIVLTRDTALRWGVDVGDTVRTEPTDEDYRGIEIEFTVVAIDETVTEWDAIALAKYDDIRLFAGGVTYFGILKQGAVAEDAFKALRARVEEAGVPGSYALEFDEWAYGASNASLSGVHGLLNILQFAVYLVGLVGVINLSVAAAMDRRREMKVYRMAGMDGKRRAQLAFAEGLFLSVSAFLVGVTTSFALNQILPSLGSILDKYMAFPVFPLSALVAGVIGVVVFTVIWTGTMLLPTEKEASINERL